MLSFFLKKRYMDLQKLQETLNKSKQIIKDMDDKLEPIIRNQKLNDMDNEYKKLCKQFSPAYLSGSSWYVGESLFDEKINDPFTNFVFMIGCMANRFSEIKK